MKLLYIATFLSLLLGFQVQAADINLEYRLSSHCAPSDLPTSLPGTLDHVKNTITNLFDLEKVNNIKWIKKSDQSLVLDVTCAQYINNVIVEGSVLEVSLVKDYLSFTDTWIKPTKINERIESLRAAMSSKGYQNVHIDVTFSKEGETQNLIVKIAAVEPPVIGEIVFSNDKLINRFPVSRIFSHYIGKNYDKTLILTLIDEVKQFLRDRGIYYSQIKELTEVFRNKPVKVVLDLVAGESIAISVAQNSELTQSLKEYLRNNLFSNSQSVTLFQVKEAVNAYLLKKGLFYSTVNAREYQGTDMYGIRYRHIYLNIKEGQKVKVSDIKFVGLSADQSRKIGKLYYANGDGLVNAGFFNKDYSVTFAEQLKKQLLSWGILYVKVNQPSFTFTSEGRRVSIKYLMQRGSVFTLSQFETNIKMINDEISTYGLFNVVGKSFNPLKLKEDLQLILTNTLNKGYYFAKYRSLSPEDIVHYDLANNKVTVKLQLDNMVKTRVKDYIITGNLKTKKWVIDKLLNLSSETELTPFLISEIKTRLLRSGIFGTVDVQTLYIETINGEDFYRLLIKAEERKGGRVVFALGYRTDLGVKGDVKVDYGNYNGEGKSFGVDVRLNQRLNNELDQIRSSAQGNLLEYNLGLRYRDPFIFKSNIEFTSKVGLIRERYYSFDADIQRLSANFRASLWKKLSFALRYQVEKVQQYNADSVINEASFRVGSLTPHFTLDFRNRAVRTSSGGKIDLSWEFANPYFGAMKEADLTINYNKIVVKSVFYVPTTFGTIALMAAMGAQKNFATEPLYENGTPVYWSDGTPRLKGYIPSIKVFRLEGMYNIRGYSFDESNMLIEGVDISTKPVQDMAYFSVFKIEPRYFYSDNLVLGLFFDAGRVFYNKFQPLNLRTSTGLSFKYVTPVGTIDLDYGVKLNRIENDEVREKFGRLHFSIGFF